MIFFAFPCHWKHLYFHTRSFFFAFFVQRISTENKMEKQEYHDLKIGRWVHTIGRSFNFKNLPKFIRFSNHPKDIFSWIMVTPRQPGVWRVWNPILFFCEKFTFLLFVLHGGQRLTCNDFKMIQTICSCTSRRSHCMLFLKCVVCVCVCA